MGIVTIHTFHIVFHYGIVHFQGQPFFLMAFIADAADTLTKQGFILRFMGMVTGKTVAHRNWTMNEIPLVFYKINVTYFAKLVSRSNEHIGFFKVMASLTVFVSKRRMY